MRSTSLFVRALPFAVLGSTFAASLPPLSQRRDEQSSAGSMSIAFNNVADPFNFRVLNPDDDDVVYVANVTIDGQSYEVELDTGSSDLWIKTQDGTLSPQAKNTNISATISYVDTSAATGDVYLAPAQFGNFSIPSQAFIHAPHSNATNDGDRGLMGLSSANKSEVYKHLRNTTFNGLPPLYNIFAAYPNVSRYMTFLLARSELGATDGGILTIGEVSPDWAAVTSQPKIATIPGRQEWVGYMDAMVVDGKRYSGHGRMAKSGATKEQRQQTIMALDSGTSWSLLPPYYWNAMYKGIHGLKLIDKTNGLYSIPCDTKRNISMVFNGMEFPVNPLDLTRVISFDVHKTGKNETICVNAFMSGDMAEVELDIILGDAFMRNAYSLFNFGNWTTPGAEPAYMQILSTTNQAAAWEQFDGLNSARIQQFNMLGGHYNMSNAPTTFARSHRRARKHRHVALPMESTDSDTEVEKWSFVSGLANCYKHPVPPCALE